MVYSYFEVASLRKMKLEDILQDIFLNQLIVRINLYPSWEWFFTVEKINFAFDVIQVHMTVCHSKGTAYASYSHLMPHKFYLFVYTYLPSYFSDLYLGNVKCIYTRKQVHRQFLIRLRDQCHNIIRGSGEFSFAFSFSLNCR